MSHRFLVAFTVFIFVAFTFTVSVADLTDGLIAYWPFNGDTNDAFGDHDGVLVGGASLVADNTRGSVLNVDGVSGHVEVPHAADMVFATSDSYTIAAWVYLEELTGSWQTIMAKSRDQGDHYGLWITDSGEWMGGGWENRGSNAVAQVWVHFAYVQDGTASSGTSYIDGEVDWSGGPRNGTGLGNFWIGGADSVVEFFKGMIDDAIVYNRALAADEIGQLASGASILAAVEPIAKLTTTWGSIK